MNPKRGFTNEFKGKGVEELLSGASRPAQICLKYDIAVSLLYYWKKQYSYGKFDDAPIRVTTMKDRIDKLEKLVGRLTLENELLKKALQNNLSHPDTIADRQVTWAQTY